MKPILWLLASLVLVLVVIGAGVFIWSGAYNIAADNPHWPVTEWLMDTARDRSIAAQASGVVVPPLEVESLIRAGAGNYDAMCVGCHLKPGVERSEASAGLYPAPPNLTRRRTDDAARTFWVIKHGIKMSGMPAWGKSMDDASIWGMVAFLQKLPGMSETDYHELVESSEGHIHGTGGHGEHDHESDQEEQEEEHVHDDGTVHEH
jgi:mono/diheme cytochrome c family protein